jgi:hypothetical protein
MGNMANPFGQKAFARHQLAGKKGLVTVLLLFVINPRRLSFPFSLRASAARRHWHYMTARRVVDFDQQIEK